MNGRYRSLATRPNAAGILLVALSSAQTIAQATPGPDDGAEGSPARLQAEISLSRTLFSPSEPVAARFTLFNPTDTMIEIPLRTQYDAAQGIVLPAELIFGGPEEPALTLQYEAEAGTALRSDSAETESGGQDARPTREGEEGVLRLAAQASLGAEVDLRPLSREMRYAGHFRLRWTPLGGRVEPAEIEFRIEPRKMAVLVTDQGKITFRLAYKRAPRNVENLIELIRERFYDGLTFHRVIPGFIIQGGSPDGTPTGIRPDGKRIPAEFHDAPFKPGTLAMARKPSDPDSASCQFFISLARLEALDGQYTVVGQAVGDESLRTLSKIAEIPTDDRDRPLRPIVIRFFTLIDEAHAPRDQAPMTMSP